MPPKYPHITVRLVGTDGNALLILGKVLAAMRRANIPQADLDAFRIEATAGHYDHLLVTVMQTVIVD